MISVDQITRNACLILDTNECISSPCQNSGHCVDQVNKFTCSCPVGFKGTLCEQSKICMTIFT